MENITLFRQTVGCVLAHKRREKQLTQSEIARKLCVERSVISKIEHGGYSLPLYRLIDYCQILNLSLIELAETLQESSYPE